MKPSLIPSRAHKRILATSATSLLAGLLSAHGQIVLNGVGAPVVETFTAAPLATSWSRSNALFGTASATISNDLTADNRVNGVTGTGVTIANTTTVLGPGGAALTATNNYFQHFTNGYVGAASTGVDGSVLMARLSNNTGSPISTLNLSWDLTLFNNSVATPETTPGHRLYWSLNGTAWNAVGNFGFIGVAGAAATRTVAQSTNIPFANWAAGTSAYLVWLDDNGLTNPDGLYALDNVSFTGVAGRTFIYNLTHGEAGAPNGALATTGNYFLEGGNPATFAAGQFAKFSQAGDATVDVPANISVGALQVTAPSGTYTIGGTGQIAGALEKSGAGTLALTSANAFVSTSLNGGNIRLSAAGALGTGGVALGASGGTLDTSINYTLNNIISGTGPLTKTGTGTLTLGGVNTHTNTTISTGAAVLSGSLATNHTLGVSSGATLTVTGSVGTGSTTTIGGRLLGTGTVNGTTTISNAATVESGALGVGTLTFQNLAFGTIAGNTANFSASLASKINVTGTFLINGGANSVTINIAGSPSGALPQTYTLIDYATIGGTGFTGFVLGTQPNRAVASLVNNTVDGRVDYTITAVDFPVWKGAVSGNWALGSQGGAENWVLNSNNATSTTFQVADNVHFDDVAGAPQTVAINGADVAVSSVTFSNNAHNYTFTGTHGISGNAPLVKSGTGTVTFNNTNSFTGGVAISAGTIQAAILANDGANSSLGSGASFALDGGATFEYTGAAPGATNRIITANNAVGAGGGTIRTSQNLTLSGAISGAGTLNKAGAGRVIIASTMTGASTVAEGVLEFGAGANFTGTTVNAAEIDIADGSAVAGTITNNNTLRITRNTAGTITSTIGGTGELTMSGLGSVTLGGAAANTFTGITRVLAGVLIAGKTAGTNAIGGNLLIDGGSFQYSAAGTQNEIPDTANITLNSGSFGDALNAGPLAQQTDVVNNVTVNGGTFGSLRSGTSAPFQVNGTLSVGATGAVLLQRGGGLSANTVSIAAGGVVNFDGGSTTGATAPLVQDSRLLVGAGGLTVTDGNFNFNAGPSGLGATSKGSRLQLNGTFTSSGTTNILRAAASLATVPQARSAIELNSGVRTFDVTGTLNLGTTAAPLSVRDGNPPVDAADTTPVPAPGGIAKNGTGILHLPGNQPYTGTTTINGGTLAIDGTLSTSSVAIRAGGTLTGQGSTVGGVTVETGGSIVAGVSGSGALSFPTLTLGTSAGDISSLSIARNGATPAIINVTGTNGLIANGGANSVTVNFGGPNPGVGQYVLIDYAGNLGGGLTAFKTGTLPNRVQTAVLEDDTVNTTIVLNISAIEVPIWTGKTSPEWSTATLAAPKNWGIVGSASTTDFLNQDNVLFDDSAQTTALEISNGDISPSAVRFNNATKSYTLTGPNVITGPATFTKDGAASVTISGANSFTGSVSLNAGTTIVDTVAPCSSC